MAQRDPRPATTVEEFLALILKELRGLRRDLRALRKALEEHDGLQLR